MRTSLIHGVVSGVVLLAQDQSPKTPIEDFKDHVSAYMKLHKAAETDRGALSPTRSPQQIEDKKSSIAEGVRAQRSNAAPGDIFTPPIATEFRRIIAVGLKHRPKRIRESIRSGEQVMTKLQVNGPYPEGLPVETMPPSILLSLPKLPSQLEYRFVGTTLVLRDVTANVIVDLIPNAIALH